MKKIISLCTVVTIMLVGIGLSTAAAQTGEAEDVSVTITEYSDYQCPACGYFHPIVEKLKDNFGDQIEVELKYFPLNNHQFAALAARAAESAKNQGKFKEMHNLIFENQKRWSGSGNPVPIFEGYAQKLELNMEQFRDDLNAAETQRAVMEEKQEGVQKGVNSTPTFFIDGQQLQNLPRTYDQFEQIVQKYLNDKKNS